MSDPLTIIMGTGLKPKPPAPSQFQVISCPVGYVGSGESQNRICTWDVATQSWQCGPWTTTSFDCTVANVVFVGPALKLTGYQLYTGPAIPGVPDGGIGHYYATYTYNAFVGGYSAQLYGEFWYDLFYTNSLGFRHEIRGLAPIWEGKSAVLQKSLKPGGAGQTATVVGGVAKFPFYANDDDNIKPNEYETMVVSVG